MRGNKYLIGVHHCIPQISENDIEYRITRDERFNATKHCMSEAASRLRDRPLTFEYFLNATPEAWRKNKKSFEFESQGAIRSLRNEIQKYDGLVALTDAVMSDEVAVYADLMAEEAQPWFFDNWYVIGTKGELRVWDHKLKSQGVRLPRHICVPEREGRNLLASDATIVRKALKQMWDNIRAHR